jgi:ABC-2 type transport system permease protein
VFGGHGPLELYVPAYIGLVWASVGLLALPVHLARYREDGVMRRLHASAASRWAVLGSQANVTSAMALAGGVLAYHIHAPRAPAGVLAAWLVAGVVFACLGILLSCIPTSRGSLGAGLGLFFVMMLSGAGRSR